MINESKLDQRITVTRETSVPDGAGGAMVVRRPVFKIWAKVRQIRGDEKAQHDQVQAVASYRFTVRSSAHLNLNASDVIEWRGMKFNLEFVPPHNPLQDFFSFEGTTGEGL